MCAGDPSGEETPGGAGLGPRGSGELLASQEPGLEQMGRERVRFSVVRPWGTAEWRPCGGTQTFLGS